jgi:hypothetical protein
MIYRGASFLVIVRFGSSPMPSPLFRVELSFQTICSANHALEVQNPATVPDGGEKLRGVAVMVHGKAGRGSQGFAVVPPHSDICKSARCTLDFFG